jgi:hypothetical protein
MRRVLSALLLAMATSVSAAPPGQKLPPPLPLPPGATPVAETTIDELRAFPEMLATSEGQKAADAHRLVGEAGVDRLYQTTGRYQEAVQFYDQRLKMPEFRLAARTETPMSTAWAVQRKDVRANIVVRNTSPTTIEIEEATIPTAMMR